MLKRRPSIGFCYFHLTISSSQALDGIVEALSSADYNTIGLLGSLASRDIPMMIDIVERKAKWGGVFDTIVRANVPHKSNISKIQDGIAETLALNFDNEKNVAERAIRLRERILMEQKILVILCDVCQCLDLDEVGIPSRTDHTSCKVLLTSTSEEVLSNHMHAQKIFKEFSTINGTLIPPICCTNHKSSNLPPSSLGRRRLEWLHKKCGCLNDE